MAYQYSPTNRRMNMIRAMCVRLVRDSYPTDYAKIVRLAEDRFPNMGVGKQGNNRPMPRKKLVLK